MGAPMHVCDQCGLPADLADVTDAAAEPVDAGRTITIGFKAFDRRSGYRLTRPQARALIAKLVEALSRPHDNRDWNTGDVSPW